MNVTIVRHRRDRRYGAYEYSLRQFKDGFTPEAYEVPDPDFWKVVQVPEEVVRDYGVLQWRRRAMQDLLCKLDEQQAAESAKEEAT